MTGAEIAGLLDEARLDGEHAVERALGPSLRAVVFDAQSKADALVAVQSLCQSWGGGCGLLLPVTDGEVRPLWEALAVRTTIHSLALRGLLPEKASLARRAVMDFRERGVDPLLAVMAGYGEKPDRWLRVEVALPDPEDPWYVAYLGSLGTWPETPDQDGFDLAGLPSDTRFDRLFEVARTTDADWGATDLLDRVQALDAMSPTRATCMLVGCRGGKALLSSRLRAYFQPSTKWHTAVVPMCWWYTNPGHWRIWPWSGTFGLRMVYQRDCPSLSLPPRMSQEACGDGSVGMPLSLGPSAGASARLQAFRWITTALSR
jgi:hypothetical protein